MVDGSRPMSHGSWVMAQRTWLAVKKRIGAGPPRLGSRGAKYFAWPWAISCEPRARFEPWALSHKPWAMRHEPIIINISKGRVINNLVIIFYLADHY